MWMNPVWHHSSTSPKVIVSLRWQEKTNKQLSSTFQFESSKLCYQRSSKNSTKRLLTKFMRKPCTNRMEWGKSLLIPTFHPSIHSPVRTGDVGEGRSVGTGTSLGDRGAELDIKAEASGEVGWNNFYKSASYLRYVIPFGKENRYVYIYNT